MHLWPSTMIRDSFKEDYLRKLEWNLSRMKSQKDSSSPSSINQILLGTKQGAAVENESVPEMPNSKAYTLLSFFLCCGASGDEEES